jgi:hypothetical protein
LLNEAAILIMDLLTHLADTSVLSVVELAVVKNELNVLHELINAVVPLLLQLSFYCSKIHRLLYNCRVVRDVELLVINRFLKDPS